MSFLDGLFRQTTTDLEVSGDLISTPEADIEAGLVYEVQAQADTIEVTLGSLSLADAAGKRFGLKVGAGLEGPPNTITVTVPDGMQIQADDGGFASVAAFTQDAGAYREYLCDDAGNWFLVASIATPNVTAPPASTYEVDGEDPINVAGLSGLLATSQTPIAHGSHHQNGGDDEISVAGLSGVLADAQKADELVFDTGAAIPLTTRPTPGQVLSFDGTGIKGAAAAAVTEFWVPPSVAGSGPGGAVDEELLSGGIPAFFTPLTTAGVALVRDGDVDTSVTPALGHYRSRVGYRGKGLLYQAAPSQSQMLAHQFSASALNADWTFRIRMGVASHLATNSTGSCMVYFCRDNGGVPDQTNNFMRFGWLSTGVADTMFLHTANFISGGGGGVPLGGMTSGNIWPMCPDGEFVVRHKNGVQVSVYFVPTNGGCQEILRVTSPIPLIFATTNPWIIIRFGTQGSGADPAMYQVRYWRWENTYNSIP